jgi:spermidine synthase
VGLTLSAPVIYLSLLIIAVCGIIYELIIGAVSSYLWGDSVYYFSITVGLYMSAMGLGAFCSKFFRTALFDWFVISEILIGILGGTSALVLFGVYASFEGSYEYAMVLVTLLIGGLVGLEIPLLIRLLEEAQEGLRSNVAHVLTYDYIGGLIGALLFPMLLLPYLGIHRSALVLGIANLLVAGFNFVRHRHLLQWFRPLLLFTVAALAGLVYLLWTSEDLNRVLEQRLYRDQVIFTAQTPYQHLTLTQWHNDIRLFINGGLQFSAIDEHRYHESLIHVPMAAVPAASEVLVLGGGDGLAIRELLKYPALKRVTLVDIDPEMIRLAQEQPVLARLNQNSLKDPRVQIKTVDAFKFVEQAAEIYDVIIVDLPDPNATGLAKLYSREFYHMLARRLSPRGALVTQSTSPFFAREAYWCIHKTLRATGLHVYPYQAEIPSFGNWGFQLATPQELAVSKLKPALPKEQLRFLTPELLPGLFALPQDIQIPLGDISENSIIQPVLLRYYQKGWNGVR